MNVCVRWVAMVCIALLSCVHGAHSAFAAMPASMPDRIEPARDLRSDAREAAAVGIPLVILVSLAGCPHCEIVRRSHLLPLLKMPSTKHAQLIRQIELNGGESLIDFDGRKTTHAEFANRHQAAIAPVVLFFTATGTRAADPLVGSMIPDFYGSYFDAALATARAAARASGKNTAANNQPR